MARQNAFSWFFVLRSPRVAPKVATAFTHRQTDRQTDRHTDTHEYGYMYGYVYVPKPAVQRTRTTAVYESRPNP